MTPMTTRISAGRPTPTIRILVPLDRLAEVLRVIATVLTLDGEATVKVQDPTRRPVRHDLPLRGIDAASPTPRWRNLLSGLFGRQSARPATSGPWLELGDPDRVRIVRIRGLRGYQDGMERLRAAGLTVIEGGGDDILLADLRQPTAVHEPELSMHPRIER